MFTITNTAATTTIISWAVFVGGSSGMGWDGMIGHERSGFVGWICI